MKYALLFILPFLMLLLSCEENADKHQSTEIKTAEFVCKKATDWSEELPKYEVHFNLNGTQKLIAVINSCQTYTKDVFKQYEIPATALAACGGWWAGGGDYLYAIKQAGEVEIFKGTQDEGQTEPGYGYERIRVIEISE